MNRVTTAAVVLAAGKGTRFKSDRAKVLHTVAGQTMLRWVLQALRPLPLDRVVVVVGHQREEVGAEASRIDGLEVSTVLQQPQAGTGHAVRVAIEQGALDGVDTVLVVPGDAPLLTSEPLQRLLDLHPGHAATLLTTRLPDPTGYGRVIRDPDGRVARIVEHRDASPAERAVDEVNTSIYAFDRAQLAEQLKRLSTDNDQGEAYLTDVIAPLVSTSVAALEADLTPVGGVNDRAQLAAAGSVLRARILERLMLAGVTVVDPAATYVEATCVVEPDVVLLPGTHLEGGTSIASGAIIGPNSRLVDTRVESGAHVTYAVVYGASIGPDVVVGPYTYLRPDARLERGAKAGAFVEVKKSVIGEGSKVPHLSYIGDASIGRHSNIGAATVTANYDGRRKNRTTIGDRVFIGSDTMLVAPVTVGDDAYTGAGSVITEDVPPGALALERSEQVNIEGYTERKRKNG